MHGLHHLHTRRNPPAGGARTTNWKRQLDRVMYVIAVTAPFAYAPQVYKLYTTQDANGLAITSFAVLFVINVLWLLYGWVHRSMPLIITSILFCVFHVIIVTGIFLYQ